MLTVVLHPRWRWCRGGASFVVSLCGDMQRMSGLGTTPNFTSVDIDDDGRTVRVSEGRTRC
jgi:formyltetrahydrofolate synthetase